MGLIIRAAIGISQIRLLASAKCVILKVDDIVMRDTHSSRDTC